MIRAWKVYCRFTVDIKYLFYNLAHYLYVSVFHLAGIGLYEV